MSKQKAKAKTSKKVAAKLKDDEIDKVEGGAGVIYDGTQSLGAGDLQQKVRLPTGIRKGKVY